MNLKGLLRIILFIFISIFLLVFLSGCTQSSVNTVSKATIDTSYNDTLQSINKIFEKNEQYENINCIIKETKFDSYSHKLNANCKENNDVQIMRDRNKRIYTIENKTEGNFIKW